MSNVISFEQQGPNGGEPAHIDVLSFSLLAILLHDLQQHQQTEQPGPRANELKRLASSLDAVLARFESPEGAA